MPSDATDVRDYRAEAAEIIRDTLGPTAAAEDLIATYVHGQHPEERADERGIADPSVRQNIRRARKHLSNAGTAEDVTRKLAKAHAVEVADEHGWLDEMRVCPRCAKTVLVREDTKLFCTCEDYGPGMVKVVAESGGDDAA